MDKTPETNMHDLEMSKNRDHKIEITDIAINKVPRVEYREIPETEYDSLQEYAKEVLRISKNSNNSNEVAITYSLNYRELIENGEDYMGISLGDEHSVDPLSSAVAYHLVGTSADCVVIVMHNHPSLSKLSLDDIKFLLQHDAVKMIVAVTNLGSISYLVKKDSYSKNDAILLYNQAVSKHNISQSLKDYQKSVEVFLEKCHEVNIVYEDR